MKLKKYIALVFLFYIFLAPTSVLAQVQDSNKLPQYNSGVDQSISAYLCTPTGDGQDLVTCINRLYKFGITTGAVIVLFMFVIAGYLYITSGETGKTKAKQYILNSLVGLGVLMGSYILLYFINPQLTIIKPIQPPIFIAPDLPSCEEVGYGQDCVVEDEDKAAEEVSGGQRIPCPDGVIDFDSSAVPNSGRSFKICKALMEKLKLLNAKHKIQVTSTIRDASTISRCHRSGNEMSGTCADIITKSGDWPSLCRAVREVGGLLFVNESATSNTDCGKFIKTKYWSGAHLHVMLGSGGGSGSTGGSTSSSGSRPNCLPVAGIPGVCGNPTNAKYKSGDWSNTKPELKTAYTNLKKKYPSIEAAQVYRSPEYGAYLRSIFEADAIINYKWTDAQVRGHGQYCSEKGIQYVTSADAKNPKVATWLSQNRGHISITSPTTCLSDHGQGIALDIDNAPNTRAFEDAAKTLGLCHDVPVYTTKGVTSGKDTRHFALVSAGVKCLNYY